MNGTGEIKDSIYGRQKKMCKQKKDQQSNSVSGWREEG